MTVKTDDQSHIQFFFLVVTLFYPFFALYILFGIFGLSFTKDTKWHLLWLTTAGEEEEVPREQAVRPVPRLAIQHVDHVTHRMTRREVGLKLQAPNGEQFSVS